MNVLRAAFLLLLASALALGCPGADPTQEPSDAAQPAYRDAGTGTPPDAGSLAGDAGSGFRADASVSTGSDSGSGGQLDAGSADAHVGPLALPAEISTNLTGAYVLTAGSTSLVHFPGPDQHDNLHLYGDLTVESGATLMLEAPWGVHGTLTLAPGATVVGRKDADNSPYEGALSAVTLVAQGTSATPVTFDGSALWGLLVSAGRLEIDHGKFIDVQLTTDGRTYPAFWDRQTAADAPPGQGGWVRDSTFLKFSDAENPVANRASFYGPGPAGLVVEFNHFERTYIDLRGTRFANNDVRPAYVAADGDFYEVVAISSLSTQNPVCIGVRDQDAKVQVENNLFRLPVTLEAPHQYWMEIGRFFGPTHIGANAFETQQDLTFVSKSIAAWDGTTTTGCGDTLGVYGGPVTVAAPLVAWPAVGPRP